MQKRKEGWMRAVRRFAAAAAAKSLRSCPTLCDPIDGSPPGSPVPGILQARTLEWAGQWKCFSRTGQPHSTRLRTAASGSSKERRQ